MEEKGQMSTETGRSEEKRRHQTTVSWNDEKKVIWDEIASKRFKLGDDRGEGGSKLARFVLEEYMALLTPREKLLEAGFDWRSLRAIPGPYLKEALDEFAAVSNTAVNPVSGVNPVHGPRIVTRKRRAR